ncbi:MAG TPA: metallophosphoesterase, partial [Xanthobacteraceae bacterium]|nr:metallophosphoesterase [Xanthobacteraceae bacterium]
MARDATFVLAHLSDLHLGPLPPPRLAELAGKRVLGYLNWQRRRHMLHRTEVIDLILADLQSHGPDHVAVTGDLVNIALPAEFTAARQQLQRVGLPDRVTFVPGNHDAYVRSAMHQPLRHWGDYMRGDKETAAPHFPFVRRRGPLALIGLSSAVPTAPFMATGTLGPQQLSKLAQTLDTLGREQMFRVVLIHHPPVSMPKDRWKRLTDAPAFRRIIAEHGAELILHGHDH